MRLNDFSKSCAATRQRRHDLGMQNKHIFNLKFFTQPSIKWEPRILKYLDKYLFSKLLENIFQQSKRLRNQEPVNRIPKQIAGWAPQGGVKGSLRATPLQEAGGGPSPDGRGQGFWRKPTGEEIKSMLSGILTHLERTGRSVAYLKT